jgi:acyl-CoA synthetase (AMP-forming)/AMP-acid ligase II/acyl carrier protein
MKNRRKGIMILNKQSFISELFEEQVKRTPEKTAIEFQENQYSFLQLNQRANQVSRVLKDNQVQAGDLIAIDFLPTFDTIASILGVLKVGAVYVPVDITNNPGYYYPILKQNGITCLLSTQEPGERTEFKGQFYYLKDPELLKKDDTNPGIPDLEDNKAPFTIIYDTGTGGITLSHQKMLNWIQFNVDQLKINLDYTLWVSSLRMNLSFPLWLANLLMGGKVYFYLPEKQNTSELINLIKDMEFSSMMAPLPIIRELVQSGMYRQIKAETLKNIVSLGEEVFDAFPFKEFTRDKKIKWHNFFGFPQISLVTTIVRDELQHTDGFRHIGRMESGTNVFILDKTGQITPAGILGELHARGNGVLEGYYKNEELEKKSFIEALTINESQVYRTGYKGSWEEDWKISLQGRMDNLKNINGIRIYLEEAEAALLKCAPVQNCAIVTRKTKEREWLTAFVVFKEGTTFPQLEGLLKSYLPKEIFPIGFVRVNSLPYDSKGQPDRTYLRELELLDTLQVKQLEEEVRKRKHMGVGDAATIVKESFNKSQPLHVKDFIKKMSKGPGKGSKTTLDSQPKKMGDGTGKAIEKLPPALVYGGDLVIEPDDPKVLPDALNRAVEKNGKQELICIRSNGTRHSYTYEALLKEAEAVLSGLRKKGLKPKDKVILQFDETEEYFCTFWGCTLAGIVPVPMGVPKTYTENNETIALKNIWEMLEKPYILTSSKLESPIRGFLNDFQTITIEDLKDNSPEKDWHIPNPKDIAVILFTSGSTGKPKGVVQNHQTILAREKGTIAYYELTKDDVSLNWLPVEHVVGLLMFHVKEICMGCTQIHVRPDRILGDPLEWLDLITEFKATITWAPNFAFGLLAETVKKHPPRNWDLSSMKLLINAGETVKAEPTKAFLTTLKPYGMPPNAMKPVWGMSETCSGVLGSKEYTSEERDGVFFLDPQSLNGILREAESPNEGIGFVSLGFPYPGVSLRIVDTNNTQLKEKMIGRLQVKGLTVTPGYYNNPKENSIVFVGDGWFDTGDLGFIFNGRVSFAGRQKDVIIINGINYNNNEIEAVVEELPNIERSFTIAYAVRETVGEPEKLAIFYHSLFSEFSQVLEQIKDIREAIIRKVGVRADYILPVTKDQIPKTSIGKIQRTKVGKWFEEGYFDSIIKKVDIGLENENTIPSWFFKKTWQKRETQPESESLNQQRNILVFEDESGLARALGEKLKILNPKGELIFVKPSHKYQNTEKNRYEINFQEPTDYQKLINTVLKETGEISDIFHCWGYTEIKKETRKAKFDDPLIKEDIEKGIYSLMYVLQAMKEKIHDGTKLFVLCNRSQIVEPEETLDFGKSGMSGFIKSVSRDLEKIQCVYMDLEEEAREKNTEYIINEWKSACKEIELVYRKGHRMIPMLKQLEPGATRLQEIPVKKDGIYLVTGALGGIGTLVCKWLMEECGARLILTGRTTLPGKESWENDLGKKDKISNRIQAYRELESLGGEFFYQAGDVSDHTFLRELERKGKNVWGEPLSGIFHLAGLGNLEEHWKQIDQHWITNESPETFENMFKSKVWGTLNLMQLLEDNPDSLFVGFSSIMSYFGGATFSTYSTANRFLDEFCSYRYHKGYPLTWCLNWSSWDDVGMTENHFSQGKDKTGFEVISQKQGIFSLEVCLTNKENQSFIGLMGNNPNIRKRMAEGPSENQEVQFYYTTSQISENMEQDMDRVLAEIMEAHHITKHPLMKLNKLEKIPLKDGEIDYCGLQFLDNPHASLLKLDLPRTEPEKKLARIWKKLLGKSEISVTDNFFELGGNSLMANQLVAAIRKEFLVTIVLVDVFTHPFIRGLSEIIEGLEKKAFIPLNPVEKKEYYELSPAQKRLYVVYQIIKDSIAYNIPSVYFLEGKFEKQEVFVPFQKLIQRHESLRTSFRQVEGELVQEIQEKADIEIEYVDLLLNKSKPDRIQVNKIIKGFIRPFTLSQAPLMRVGLIRLEPFRSILMVDMSHIITDGISHIILVKEFFELLNKLELPGLKIHYKDFSQWQNKNIETEARKKQEQYWLKEFDGEIPVLNLALDFLRSGIQSFSGDELIFIINEELYGKLRNLMKETNTTLYMALLTVCFVLLSKVTTQEDLVIGSPIAGRRHSDLESVVGIFVGQLPVRSYPQKQKTFKEFLIEVRDLVHQGFENQDYPFHELIKKLNLQGDYSRNPLFDVVFAMEESMIKEKQKSKIKFSPYRFENFTSKTDLRFGIIEEKDRILVRVTYATALFKRKTCQKLAFRYIEVLEQVLQHNGIKLQDIHIHHDLIPANAETISSGEYEDNFGF